MDHFLRPLLADRTGLTQIVLPCVAAAFVGAAAGVYGERMWAARRVHRPASSPSGKRPATPRWAQVSTGESTSSSELGSGDESDCSSSDSTDDNTGAAREHKMVLVVRTDLGMTKGKLAAQCCHAAVAAVSTARRRCPETLRRYQRHGAAKVALKCSSEEELLTLYAQARSAGLIAEYIEDAGRTQIPEGSRTVLAIGPAPIKQVDAITGHLKLL
ncbi:hypothetical protein HDU87_001494 [Geranomyces variabilis]|uniref:peptidyl-tRNA hydrolase n=1 Tax=Geranomyces variabilis TaxID=109894 RepID=A0AAD5XIZ3_9FUNG|nr:hypothetical protein HDU87_001494 [Geranomyces variabilis]